MQISARNQLEGIIREINEGPINSEITIEVAPEIMVTAQITIVPPPPATDCRKKSLCHHQGRFRHGRH